MGLLDDRDESIRGWAIRLLADGEVTSPETVNRLFEAGAIGIVAARPVEPGLGARSGIPVKDRWPLAEALAVASIDPSGPDAAAHDLVRDRAAGGRRSRPGRRPGGRLQDCPCSATTWRVAPWPPTRARA